MDYNKEYVLKFHVTNGGAVYLTDNDYFFDAKIVIRVDGGIELLKCEIEEKENENVTRN